MKKSVFYKSVSEGIYEIIKNNADGNCLFESVAQLLFNDIDRYGEIRQSICDFHKGFACGAQPFVPLEDEFSALTQRSNKQELINNLKFVLLQDEGGEAHAINVCENNVYARDSEIVAICLFYQVNIKIYMESKTDSMSIFDLIYDQGKPTLHLHFVPGMISSEGGHYQAIKVKKRKSATKNVSKKMTPSASPYNKTIKSTKQDSSQEKIVKKIKKYMEGKLDVSSDEIRKAVKSANGDVDKAMQTIVQDLQKKSKKKFENLYSKNEKI